METCAVAVVNHLAAGHLLGCEPLAVGKGVFHLVAVFPDVFRALDGRYFRQLDLGYACERVDHLLLFTFKLGRVGQMLPAAATACAEVRAPRGGAHVARLDDAGDAPFGVRFAFLGDLDVDHVARGAVGNEDNHVVDASEGISLGCHACYRDPFEQGIGFAFS